MTQFFRALTELGEMNLANTLRTALWNFEKVSFELFLENRELSFYVVCDKYYASILEKQITTFFSSANIEYTGEPILNRDGDTVNGHYLYTERDDWFPIKDSKEMENDPLNDLANVFSQMGEDERAVVQIVVNPTSDDRWRKKAKKEADKYYKRQKEFHIPIISDIPLLGSVLGFLGGMFLPGGSVSNAPGAKSGGDSYIRMLEAEEKVGKRMGVKASQFNFECAIRVLASSPRPERVEDILNNIIVGFTVFKDGFSNWFQNRRIFPLDIINSPLILHGFQRRLDHYFFGKTCILVPDELATLFHFPDAKYNDMPIIKWLDYKVLAPPGNMPKEGTLLGINNFRGQPSDVYIKNHDRSRHMYVLGKSGSGKSVLLSNMARQDAQIEGRGFCVVDPHGDLIEDILCYIPKKRVKDVVVFNPADIERPMGLNLLEAHTPEEKDRASLDAMNIFIKLFGNEIFGPRIQHYFRNGCLTLMDDEEEGATLLDIPRLFIDDAFQKYKVSKCKNSVVRQFWESEMANTGEREKQEMIPYFTSKFGPFVTNTTMRNIIGQKKSAFNIREMMDNGKILLVNLSKGKIGDINAQLLGMIFVNKISMAAMSRADIPERKRRDFYLYVDEFQNFATDAFADILSEARKYHLALIMAHQYIDQLKDSSSMSYSKGPPKLLGAVFGNVGSILTFKVGASDAEQLEKEYAPVLTRQDILGISNYKAYVKLNIDNATSRPFSLGTIWDQTGRNEKAAEIVKKYSRLKYGRKKEFVDAEIEARLGIVK